MAEKSLVKDVAEMLGVAEDDEVDVDDDEAELLALDALEVVLLLELLPHPAATADTTRPNTHKRNLRALIPARSSHRRATLD
jgi:hypothetical protein